jgi:hypothetical protein
MTIEEIFAASEAAARAELGEAEAAVLDAEAAVRAAREELDIHLVERATLREAIDQIGPNSPSAARLHRRLQGLRHAEGPLALANAGLENAKRRVLQLKQEVEQMTRLAAPPEPAAAEAEDMAAEDTVLN